MNLQSISYHVSTKIELKTVRTDALNTYIPVVNRSENALDVYSRKKRSVLQILE